MAEDLRINRGTDTAVTISLDDLANNTNVLAATIDSGNPGPFIMTLEYNGLGLATGTGFVFWFAQFSNDGTDYSDNENDKPVGSTLMNAAVAVKHVFAFEMDAQHVIIRARNESGVALGATGNTLRRVTGSVDQV